MLPVAFAASTPQEFSPTPTNENRIGLGTAYVIHGDANVDMPVYISLAPDVKLSRISFDLVFPREKLLWIHAEAGIQAGLSVKGETRSAAEGSSQTTIRLEIEVDSPIGIANGVIASVRLRLKPEAGLGTIPVSIAEVIATGTSTPDESAVDIAGFGANVKVVTPDDYPAVACFFFAH